MRQQHRERNGAARWIGAVGVAVAILVAVLMLIVRGEVLTGALGRGVGLSCADVGSYFLGARVLCEGGNPYDWETLYAARTVLPQGCGSVSRIYTPPAVFSLLLPACFLSPTVFQAAWLVSSLLFFSGCAIALRRHLLYHRTGGSSERDAWPLSLLVLLGTFYPIYRHLILGQIVVLMLVGVSASLLLAKRHPLWAGAALGLTAFKPHLLLPYYAYWLVGEFRRRNWRALIGFAVAVMLLYLLPLFLNSSVYAWHQAQPLIESFRWKTPTIATWLRLVWDGPPLILLAIPSAVGMLLALLSAWREQLGNTRQLFQRRCLWLAVSLLVAPYAWLYDYVLLLPVLIHLFTCGIEGQPHRRWLIMVLIAASVPFTFGRLPLEYGLLYPALLTSSWLLANRRYKTSSCKGVEH